MGARDGKATGVEVAHQNIRFPMARKRSEKEAANAELVAKAIAGLNDGTYKTVNQASLATGAPRTTVYRHLNGGLSRVEAHAHQQALLPNEERILESCILRLSTKGHHITHQFVRDLAEGIRVPRLEEEQAVIKPLGDAWIQRFIQRHPSLKTVAATSIDRARKETMEVIEESSENNRPVDES
jgi:Tc5 transposase DNA-binding domain